MFGLSIETSKPGRIWPAGYWKPLIDSLSRGGTKKDPREIYPDLSVQLGPLIVDRNGRFGPSSASNAASSDDSAISYIQVARVKPGDEAIRFVPPKIPDIVHWVMLDFPYFGTIGNTKYEEQTKRNRIALKARLKDVLGNEPIPTAVSLHFQLTSQRRERDLDNLADALMPFFNMHIPSLSSIQLSKAEQLVRSTERLWLSAAFTPRADEGQ